MTGLRRTLLAVLVAVAAGCTTAHRVAPGGLATVTPDLNRLGSRQPARVLFADGRRASVRSVRVEADSVSWIRDGRLETVAVADVSTVRFLDRGRGVGEGAVVGLGSGLVLGVALGVTSQPDEPAGYALLGAYVFSLFAVPVGALAGLADGHQTVYHFPPPDL